MKHRFDFFFFINAKMNGPVLFHIEGNQIHKKSKPQDIGHTKLSNQAMSNMDSLCPTVAYMVVSYVSLNGAFLKNEKAFNRQEGLMTDAIELP